MKTHLVIPDGYNVMRDGTVVSHKRAQIIKKRNLPIKLKVNQYDVCI